MNRILKIPSIIVVLLLAFVFSSAGAASIEEVFIVAKKDKAAPAAPVEQKTESLNGSNALPATVKLADGHEIALSDIVIQAHANSGLTIEQWNKLPDDERDSAIKQVFDDVSALTVDVVKAQTTAARDKLVALEQANATKNSKADAAVKNKTNATGKDSYVLACFYVDEKGVTHKPGTKIKLTDDERAALPDEAVT